MAHCTQITLLWLAPAVNSTIGRPESLTATPDRFLLHRVQKLGDRGHRKKLDWVKYRHLTYCDLMGRFRIPEVSGKAGIPVWGTSIFVALWPLLKV